MSHMRCCKKSCVVVVIGTHVPSMSEIMNSFYVGTATLSCDGFWLRVGWLWVYVSSYLTEVIVFFEGG